MANSERSNPEVLNLSLVPLMLQTIGNSKDSEAGMRDLLIPTSDFCILNSIFYLLHQQHLFHLGERLCLSIHRSSGNTIEIDSAACHVAVGVCSIPHYPVVT